MARLGLAGTGVPVVEHVHSHFAAGVSRRLLSFRGHVLIGCSRSVGRMLVDDFGRRPSQVRVIPNAVDDVGTHVRSDPARPSSGRKRILAVGRLSDVKDPLRFVGVINALVARGCAVEGEWVGDGPLRSEVEREIDRTGAPVTLSGHSDDVPEKLHGADVMLMTSRFEGMPLVVLEAMSLSRVVVAPDVGGLSELVVDGVTGVVYHPGADTAEIASRIAGVLAVPEVRADMEREARARFVALSDMETMVESVRAVYGVARKELHGERDG
jgi:glycosyltransferase involved in cell wall biosynthesis